MKSMTGFGRGSAAGENFNVSVDLKTVNNRFLDVHLRTGAELSSLENTIRRRIGEELSRGRVDATIVLDRTSEVAYEMNRPLIAGFIQAMRSVQEEFSLAGEPDINVLARMPNALQPVRDGNLTDAMKEGVERAVGEALAELNQMRGAEGEALAAEMHARLDEIERQVPVIEAVAADLVETYRARLQRRISELLARDGLEIVELDQGRLAQEVAYLADRSDISEELARLHSHVKQFREIIDSEGDTGKRLDFLLQEFNREANTVLSKSTDMTIKEAALAIKAEVEKLREQVQNVE
ncbi:MAG TPA: YicC/YloC family endoribonuclease [Pyrinomonadaceae bacterium]|nr:YicC/YloC family endoribonuclease [Pyrinomonadaceae bacterium]